MIDVSEAELLAVALLPEAIRNKMAQAPKPQYRHPLGYSTWGTEEVIAALECLCDQRTTMWTKVERFEDEFAQYLGTPHGVMVNSGSSADLVMMLAARELGLLNPGDEILIPAVTWPTQVWAAIQAGFKVKLVDVESSTLNTSPEILERAITPKTKAIFLVHLMGNPCDMEAINGLAIKHNLRLFEDCCEALGASIDGRKVGTFGTASTFSFFASHHISTMEGGMIATDYPEFADMCRSIRAHGWARDLKDHTHVAALSNYSRVEDLRYLFLGMGFNFRPTELQGAIGSVQLAKLDNLNRHRMINAARVNLEFRATNGHFIQYLAKTHHQSVPAWFGLPFVLREGLPYSKKQVCKYLNACDIDTRPIVGGNLARQPAFSRFSWDMLSGADVIHDRGFYIGLPPYETDRMNSIIGSLNAIDSMLRAEA